MKNIKNIEDLKDFIKDFKETNEEILEKDRDCAELAAGSIITCIAILEAIDIIERN